MSEKPDQRKQLCIMADEAKEQCLVYEQNKELVDALERIAVFGTKASRCINCQGMQAIANKALAKYRKEKNETD